VKCRKKNRIKEGETMDKTLNDFGLFGLSAEITEELFFNVFKEQCKKGIKRANAAQMRLTQWKKVRDAIDWL
jgi:hypothetical protein